MHIIDTVLLDKPDELEAKLAKGANPNYFEDKVEATLLHFATLHCRYEAIKILIKYGASPHLKDTALHLSPMDIALNFNDQTALSLLKCFH